MIKKDKVLSILEIVNPHFKRMDVTIKKYTEVRDYYDVNLFENVKRELIDILANITDYHAEIKFLNSMYVEARKTKKAEVVENLIEGGVKITEANSKVYNVEEYKEYLDIVFIIEKVYNRVNSRYYLLLNTVDAIQQSIAIARNVESK